MWSGWARFGGVEIFNSSRLRAYTGNGVKPFGVKVEPCDGACEDFNLAVGDDPYTLPINDLPPWFTGATPEGAQFGGLLVLEITGAKGSTSQTPVIERVRAGGVAVRSRVASKTISVSALALASTPDGLDAGLTWLSSALHEPCADTNLCGGSRLEFFTACPMPVCPTFDPNTAPVRIDYPPNELSAFGGTWDPATSLFTVVGAPPANTGVLLGPILGCGDEPVVEWNVVPTDGLPLTVTPLATGPAASQILAQAPTQIVPGTGGLVTWTVPKGAFEQWRPALSVAIPGATISLAVTDRPPLTLDDCVDPSRRMFKNVVCVAGPTVVEEIADDDGEITMARVEWTWVATDPFRYSVAASLLEQVPSGGGPPAFTGPGIQLDDPKVVTAAATLCTQPVPVLRSCTDLPANCCTTLTAPPLPPVPPDPCLAKPASWNRREWQLPPELVPEATGVLSFVLFNDTKPKTGVRIRVWEDPDPDFGGVPECPPLYETFINYIDGDAVFTVDGTTGGGFSTCDGVVEPQRADRVMRGRYDGPVVPLVVGCSNRYHIAVDVPVTYPTTCTGVWVSGQSQGALSWSASLTRRDG